jgi:hypothetical protein
VFAEPLPSNDRRDTQTDGRRFMKYPAEMGSGVVIYSYITNFIKISSGSQNLRGKGGSQTHGHNGDCINLLSFFQNKESRL